MIEQASPGDVPAIVALVNAAYEVEAFFVEGPRVESEEIERDQRAGRLFVGRSRSGALEGCVFYEGRSSHGYFGLLAVDPRAQGRGLGRQLVAFVEDRAREEGLERMRIAVVNLRTELPAWYEALGYRSVGTEAFESPRKRQPAHFVIYEKQLQPEDS